jgi:ATP-binding cassette, subfamily B, bacterial PglK
MFNLKSLWRHITGRRRKQLALLLFLMICTSLLEMLSVGSVLPFIGALTNPEHLFEIDNFQFIYRQFNITSADQLVLPFSIIFICATLFAGLVRIVTLYLSSYLIQLVGADLSLEVYKRSLYQDYLVHVSRNSSEIINNVIMKTNMVSDQVIGPVLTIIGSLFIITGLVLVLVIIDIKVSLTLFFSLSILYFLIMLLTKEQLEKNSDTISILSNERVKTLQEGLIAYREVLLNQAQEFYSKFFQKVDLPVRRAFASSQFLSGCPKFAIEAIGMSLVAIVAYSMTAKNSNTLGVLPVLAAFAIGAQRILPALQQMYSSYSSIKSANESFKEVMTLLDQPFPSHLDNFSKSEINFVGQIELRNISFRYQENSPFVLKDINLKINKGEAVGFIGQTGSGKSTLIDIILGLLPPTEGTLLVDGVKIDKGNRHLWQRHISSVPQNITLFDSSIRENVAFGINLNKIDDEKIVSSIKVAQLFNLVESWENKYQTIVGEHGVRISGGQRQRIGLARALYKESSVLVLDEATSALDNETETKVIESLNQSVNKVTILMIAHRTSTLKNCNKIIKLSNNKTIHTIDYSEIDNS